MKKPEVGKRDHKKAQTKIQIMNTFIKAMESQPLDKLRIEDLCKEIGISKVTFFNYFSSKEQIIEYFIYKWQYDLCYELSQNTLYGIDAVRRIFHSVSEHPAATNIMTTLMQFYLSHPNFDRMEVTPYEYYMFNEKAYEAGTPHIELPDIVSKALEQMGLPKAEIGPTVLNLISGFYGVAFVMHIAGGTDLNRAYDNFINSILKLDQE